jgi:hypothetical protein
MNDFSHLEQPLHPDPVFHVQPPDGRRAWSEIDRQVTLFAIMRHAAPQVVLWATANAGKRNPAKARKEGIKAGVFDVQAVSEAPLCAWVELKGYQADGRAGKLRPAQIEWGNRMSSLGHHVACFFDPYDAADWLRSVGFPVAGVRRAA